MIYLINKIKKKFIFDEGVEWHPAIIYAEADSFLDAVSKLSKFLETNLDFKIENAGFDIAEYKLSERVEITIK